MINPSVVCSPLSLFVVFIIVVVVAVRVPLLAV